MALKLLGALFVLALQAALALAMDWALPDDPLQPDTVHIADATVHATELLLLLALVVMEAVVQQHQRLRHSQQLEPLLAQHIKDEESGKKAMGTGEGGQAMCCSELAIALQYLLR